MTMDNTTSIDPTTLSGIWYYLQRVCDEMINVIERTARSYLIGQQHDVSVGIWDASGRTLAIGHALPLQSFTSRFAIQTIVEKYGADIHPGDVFLTNDPYHGGHNNHLPDWGFIKPIFSSGKLKFFCLVRGHMQDTGGMFPGGYFPNAHDIIAEGLCIPPMRIIDKGKPNEELLKLIYSNVRLPNDVRMDNAAMLAAADLCDQRLQDILLRHGEDTFDRCCDEIISRTERSMRAAIGRVRPGTYYGTAAIDDDGTEFDVPVHIHAKVTISHDRIDIDLSESDAQRPGFINCVLASTYAGCLQGVFMCLDPSLADFINEGAFIPINVTAKEGLVVNASFPATVGGMGATVSATTEAVLMALAQALPDQAIGAWGRHRGVYIFGTDPRTSERYVRTYLDATGGTGGMAGFDGDSGTMLLVAMGLMTRSNIEEVESRYPWEIESLEFACDTAGAGQFRGGSGYRWVLRNDGSRAGIASGQSDGDREVGQGVNGGFPSPQSRTYLVRGTEEIPVPSKRLVWAEPGDRLVMVSGGGAGVGDPRQRDIERVRTDVEYGIVSVKQAEEVYGVCVDPDNKAVDYEKTRALRA